MQYHYSLYTTAEYHEQATQIVETLAQRQVSCEIQLVESVNAKFLRQNPQLALCYDQQGLSLTVNGMKMNPDWSAEIPRLKRASIKSELIARACNLSEKPNLLDATAGLGHDALLLAHLGANVTLVERHPVLFTLLETQLQHAKEDYFLNHTAQRIQLIFDDAQHLLQQFEQQQRTFDVVYLDPMFPQRNQNTQKKAQVKKQMQVLHYLLEDDSIDDTLQNPHHLDLGDALLNLAQKISPRVIVKRPKYAIFLNNQEPQHQWLGESSRFDAYFQSANPI